MMFAAALVASLQLTFFPHGHAGAARVWTLHCGPAGGTHPHPALACTELLAHPEVFARQPVCTLMLTRTTPYARIAGTFRGRRVLREINAPCSPKQWRALHVLITGAS